MGKSLLEKVLENSDLIKFKSYVWTFGSGILYGITYDFIQQENLKNSLIAGGATLLSSGLAYGYYKKSKLNNKN